MAEIHWIDDLDPASPRGDGEPARPTSRRGPWKRLPGERTDEERLARWPVPPPRDVHRLPPPSAWKRLPGEPLNDASRFGPLRRPASDARVWKYLPGERTDEERLNSSVGPQRSPSFEPGPPPPGDTFPVPRPAAILVPFSVSVADFGALGREITTRGTIEAKDLSILRLPPGEAALFLPPDLFQLTRTCRPGIGIAGADRFQGAAIPLLTRVVAVDLVHSTLKLDPPATAAVEDAAVFADDRPPIQDALNTRTLTGAVYIPPGTYRIGTPGAVFQSAAKPGNQPLFIGSGTLVTGQHPTFGDPPPAPDEWPLLKLADDVAQVQPGVVQGQLSDRCTSKNATLFMNRRNGFWYQFAASPGGGLLGAKELSQLPSIADHDITLSYLHLDGNFSGQAVGGGDFEMDLWEGGDPRAIGPQVEAGDFSKTEADTYVVLVGYSDGKAFAPAANVGQFDIAAGKQLRVVLPPRAPNAAPIPVLFFAPLAAALGCPARFRAKVLPVGAMEGTITRADFALRADVRPPGWSAPASSGGSATAVYLDNVYDCRVHHVTARHFLDGALVAGGADANPAEPVLGPADANALGVTFEEVDLAANFRHGLAISGRARDLRFIGVGLRDNISTGCDIEIGDRARYVFEVNGVKVFEPIPQSLGLIEFRGGVVSGHRLAGSFGIAIQPVWGVRFDDVQLIGVLFTANDTHLAVGQRHRCDRNHVDINGECAPLVMGRALPVYPVPWAKVHVDACHLLDSLSIGCILRSGDVTFLNTDFQRNNWQLRRKITDQPADILIEANTSQGPLVEIRNFLFLRDSERYDFPQLDEKSASDHGSIEIRRGTRSVTLDTGTFDDNPPVNQKVTRDIFIRRGDGAVFPGLKDVVLLDPRDDVRVYPL